MPEPAPAVRRLTLRRAGAGDSRAVWAWRNEAATRAASFSSDPIPWEAHERWFASRLNSPGTRIWIASDADGRPLGYARFDIAQRTGEISVALDADLRGRHWGRAVIRAASEAEMRGGDVDRVIAHIKRDNPASLAAFQAAGFVMDGEVTREGVAAWSLHFEPALMTAE